MSYAKPADAGAAVLVTGHLTEPLSRWLWLVKWLLLVPHYVVLAFLWLAFLVVTVVAFFAILVTGRYPRSLFAFNLGVMRWTWRVEFYGYSALGTDRYPPFTLAERPDHPAVLDVRYPEHLSRGLVLVKWWLLALPHYLLLAAVTQGVRWTTDAARGDADGAAATTASVGLLGLLALFLGIALLFTGRPARGLFDLLVGFARWQWRVVAYAALMTDAYPPFRLDQGGADPGQPVGPEPPGAPSGAAAAVPVGAAAARGPASDAEGTAAGYSGVPAARAGRGGRAGRRAAAPVAALVVGLLALLPGLVLTGLGTGALVLDAQRDAAGYVTSPQRTLSTPTAALTAEDVDIELDRTTATWLSAHRLGTVRVHATSTDGSPVFVGVAPQAEVDTWLADVAHDRLTDLGDGRESYQRHPGAGSAGAPADQAFWTASTAGGGTQELTWPVASGRWSLVVARADGAPGVSAAVDVGARIPSLAGVGGGMLAAGLGLLALAVVLVVLGAVGLGRRHAEPEGGPGAAGVSDAPPTGPPSVPPVEARPTSGAGRR